MERAWKLLWKKKKTSELKIAQEKTGTTNLISDALNHPLVTDAVEIFKGERTDAKI